MKKGFTLTEILIVLVIIGVLATVSFPLVFQNKPNENIAKFQKGDAALKSVISQLVNSQNYYSDGDLGISSDGSIVQNPTYLCLTISDLMSTKSVNCSVSSSGNYFIDTESTTDNQDSLDEKCLTVSSGSEIITTDKIVFYQVSPSHTFGIYDTNGKRIFSSPKETPTYVDSTGLDRMYKILCMDVDGINNGEAPFGYGLRADGKILPGPRAQQWTSKRIQD